jgi:hypothetical protein
MTGLRATLRRRYLTWLLDHPRPGVAHAPFPLRDSTGSHWLQVFDQQTPGRAAQSVSEWMWCCCVCTTLSRGQLEQDGRPSGVAPHTSTEAHQTKLREWDSDERHACMRMPAPVWSPAHPFDAEIAYQP